MSKRAVADPAIPIPIAIVSAGAVTCVGLTAASTCAAIRASLDGFAETDFVDQIGQPVLGARVPDGPLGLDADEPESILGGAGKLAAMFVRAATECVRAAGGIDAASKALLLIGPESTRPGFTVDKLQDCFAACEQAVGKRFHAASLITQLGGPGLAVALQHAQRLLASAQVDAVLLAGLDSLLNGNDIGHALANNRLLCSEHSDGFIPGEAAACVLVMRLHDLQAHDQRGQPRGRVLQVLGAGVAQESESWSSGKANTGKGLAAAVKSAIALAGIEAHDIHHRLSDASGESFFMDEGTYAWGRVLRKRSPAGYTAPLVAASVGETAAAAGPLMAALALDMARKGWSAGPITLIHLAGSAEVRGAVVLQAV